MSATASSDAGLTMFELIVALAITAGLLTMIASSIRPPAPGDGMTPSRLVAFVSSVRTAAVLTGTATVLEIGPTSLAAGDTRLEWTDPAMFVSDSGGRGRSGFSVIAYPDGTLSGEQLFIRTKSGAERIDAVFRRRTLTR